MKIDYNQIIENLKQVHDPEISINVYDLGLIYDIRVMKKTHGSLLHTPSQVLGVVLQMRLQRILDKLDMHRE